MKVVYEGGIKPHNAQICTHCGFTSQDVKEFYSPSMVLDDSYVVSESCLDCFSKHHKHEIDDAMFNAPDSDL